MDIFCDTETYQGLPSPASIRSSDAAQWQISVKDIKMLYHSHRHKRCANQCESILNDEANQVRYTYRPQAQSFWCSD
jgi:hypothetical protein